MRTLLISCMIIHLATFQLAQAQNTLVLKCKVQHLKTGLMPNYPLLINGQQALTDGQGFMYFPIRTTNTYVTIETLNSSKISILYPVRGHLSIPKDENEILEVVLGSPEDSQLLHKKYVSVIQKMIQESNNALIESSRQQFDSLALLIQTLEKRNRTLEEEKARADARQKIFQEISGDIREYSIRAANLSLALKHSARFAYENGLTANELNTAVMKYNAIFERLSPRRNVYEQNVTEYWSDSRDDSAGDHFKTLMRFAMDTLHEQHILSLMAVIDQINDYRQRLRNGDKVGNADKQKIQLDIEKKLTVLEPEINELLARVSEFQKLFTL